MKPHKLLILFFAFIFFQDMIQAQPLTQTIRGEIIDQDAQTPLTGVMVQVTNLDPPMGAYTDETGYFRIEHVPVGRIDIAISYMGYEPQYMKSILLTPGKELVLNIKLQESAIQMDDVVITAEQDKKKPINEFATVSARSFSVEETSRYAASFYDPARMAMNYAGVNVGSGEDLFNEIIVRGNSPRGILWRLEGIEIPNPNHFGAQGNSGGGISMLSSSTLSNSDFYTGAFPAEFGNALSGVFDLNLRKGNNEKREYSLMAGVLGIEAAAEGPFSKNSKASYLVNYRYSTLAALDGLGLNPAGDILPAYQDLSFHFYLPTRNFGTFSVFGLGGSNTSEFEPEKDSTSWDGEFGNDGFVEKQQVATAGISHKILLNEKSYLKTVVAASVNEYKDDYYYLDADNNYARINEDNTTIEDKVIRVSSTYNQKFNAKNTLRAGAIFSHKSFDFQYNDIYEDGENIQTRFDNSGETQIFQGFAQWKHRFNESLTLNAGAHYTHFFLNDNFSLEPRVSLSWQMSPKHSLSVAGGIHSKTEHLAVYLFEGELPGDRYRNAARDLELTKAAHAVLAYDYNISNNLRLKLEAYYQHLYDVPVEDEAESTASIINAFDIWDVIWIENASNNGTGRNYGLDLTLEKFFHNQYYFLVTGSLFDSKFTPNDGREYNTRFNSNYQVTLLGGKEFKVGKSKKNILGFNGKFLLSGGNRMTPIDLEASREEGYTVRIADQLFGDRAGEYFRLDLGMSYRINKKKTSQLLSLDIQNVSNRLNVFTKYYDPGSETIEAYYQTGLFPVLNYRFEF